MNGLVAARGPLSAALLGALASAPGAPIEAPPCPAAGALADDDLQLALYLCYELHYRGLPGVDERWEWAPPLLAFRGELERRFEQALLEAVPFDRGEVPPEEVDLALRAIAEQDAPPLSRYVRSKASLGQVREFLV